MDGAPLSPQAKSYHAVITSDDGGRVSAAVVRFLMTEIESSLGAKTLSEIAITADVAHYITEPPGRMINELDASAFFRATRLHLDDTTAEDIFYKAGQRMARYLLRSRIPTSLTGLSSLLPRLLRESILTSNMLSQAYLFIPRERFKPSIRLAPRFSLKKNPLPSPNGAWHCGMFDTIYRAVVGGGYRFTRLTERDGDDLIETFAAKRA